MKLLAAILLLLCSASAQHFSPDPYFEDFNQLLSEMSVHYANLEWVANDRRTDLPKLKARTEERLRNARSEEEAHAAFARFIRGLGDGHVEIRWPTPKASQPDQHPAAKSFCERLGYDQQDNDGGIDWSVFPGFKPLDGADADDFPGGLLSLGGQTLGIVRIGLFSEHAHPALCREAQKRLNKADDAECTAHCEDDFEYAVADLLTAALERRGQALHAAGADYILVDITGNGGGSDWVEPAARVLTSVPLKSPRIAFVRSQHWVSDLQSRLDVVNADLKRPVSTANIQIQLTHARRVLQDSLDQASASCDRSVLWTNAPTALHCSQIVKPDLFTSGTVAYARPDSLPSDLKSQYILFNPLHYRYHEGANTLPLIVLVDDNTASSAEYFAAMLQDNHAATIAGTVTAGCGCGFTNGGIPTTLKNSHAEVRLPDCIRLRADGSNEVAGITPNILLPWTSHDSRYQHAVALKLWFDSPQGQSSLHR